MITTKRQIIKESDHYGGYAYSRVAPTVEPDVPSDILSMNGYAQDNSIMISGSDNTASDIRVSQDTATAATERPLYSTRETVKTELPKRPEKEKASLNREDLMPSIKTQRAAEKVPEEKAAELSAAIPVRRERGKLSPRTKVMLFIYVAVALVLAIAVIATGVAISNVSAESSVWSARITSQKSELNATNVKIAEATDTIELKAKAEELGMVEAPEAVENITLLDRVDYPTAKPHVNWFDKLADWMSKILN